jgi:hypothetical protein
MEYVGVFCPDKYQSIQDQVSPFQVGLANETHRGFILVHAPLDKLIVLHSVVCY